MPNFEIPRLAVAVLCSTMLFACGTQTEYELPQAADDSGVRALPDLAPPGVDASPRTPQADPDSGQLPDAGDPPAPPSTPPPPPPPPTPKPPSRYSIAAHWAPVWYQDTDDTDHQADYITRYDFDGNKRGDDNWDNLHDKGADLRATVYYSVVETDTHYFILYTVFHPRDWDDNCNPWLPFSEPCHENDLEGAMVVARKAASAPHGIFEVLYTEAHNTLHIYTNNPLIKKGSSPNLESGVKVTFEKGSHPELYIESKGHGVCALFHDGDKHCKHSISSKAVVFPGGDGIVYRHKGYGQTPKSGNDRDVGYSLRSMKYSYWTRRGDICDSGCTFDKPMVYNGKTYGSAFDGDSYGKDKANPPWAWDDPKDGPVYRGDFFFRPAKALATHLKLPLPISQKYVYNPFLDDTSTTP